MLTSRLVPTFSNPTFRLACCHSISCSSPRTAGRAAPGSAGTRCWSTTHAKPQCCRDLGAASPLPASPAQATRRANSTAWWIAHSSHVLKHQAERILPTPSTAKYWSRTENSVPICSTPQHAAKGLAAHAAVGKQPRNKGWLWWLCFDLVYTTSPYTPLLLKSQRGWQGTAAWWTSSSCRTVAEIRAWTYPVEF